MHIIRAAADVSDRRQKVSLSASNQTDNTSCTSGWGRSMYWHRGSNCNYAEGWMLCFSSVELKSKEESYSVQCTEKFSTYRWSSSGACLIINRGLSAQATQVIRCSAWANKVQYLLDKHLSNSLSPTAIWLRSISHLTPIEA